MFPIALDIAALPIALVGSGEKAESRLAHLTRAGAGRVTRYTDRLPDAAEIKAARLLLIVDVAREDAARLAAVARENGVLVNVEDDRDYCDFYFMSEVRRGDLLIAISTHGASPALAIAVKEKLSQQFGEEWSAITDTLKQQRDAWRAAGHSLSEVLAKTRALIKERGWL